METIHSTVLKDDPDMLELVNKFLSRLPDMIARIIAAHSADNPEELASELHKLKGIAGGYGYPGVTELAAQAEQHCKNLGIQNIRPLLDTLRETCSHLAP